MRKSVAVFEAGQFGRYYSEYTNCRLDDVGDEENDNALASTGTLKDDKNYSGDLQTWLSYFLPSEDKSTPYNLQKQAEASLRSLQMEYEREKTEELKLKFTATASRLIATTRKHREATSVLPWGFPVSFGLTNFPDMGTGVVATSGMQYLPYF